MGVGVCILGAYLLGSVPFGWLLGRSRGIDIRQSGSGNIGATNLSRALGRKWGILAFVLDYLKGCAPTGVGLMMLARPGNDWPAWLAVAMGAAAILGHVFPIFLRFRGGKGVATAFGVMTVLSWPATVCAGGVWLLAYVTTRTVSVASLLAAITLPVATVAFPTATGDAATSVSLFALGVAILILIRHRSNFVRLLRGEELRFR